ncbi:hypothetical protein C8J57DRAFT_1595446 [Mycena rebaudengoi]|nr:hypothetical protein C8J57DRAFT_1595446 [Mycena rebaudengoi]
MCSHARFIRMLAALTCHSRMVGSGACSWTLSYRFSVASSLPPSSRTSSFLEHLAHSRCALRLASPYLIWDGTYHTRTPAPHPAALGTPSSRRPWASMGRAARVLRTLPAWRTLRIACSTHACRVRTPCSCLSLRSLGAEAEAVSLAAQLCRPVLNPCGGDSHRLCLPPATHHGRAQSSALPQLHLEFLLGHYALLCLGGQGTQWVERTARREGTAQVIRESREQFANYEVVQCVRDAAQVLLETHGALFVVIFHCRFLGTSAHLPTLPARLNAVPSIPNSSVPPFFRTPILLPLLPPNPHPPSVFLLASHTASPVLIVENRYSHQVEYLLQPSRNAGGAHSRP